MVKDFIKGYPGWFKMWLGSVGHRCGWNRFRVTKVSKYRCGCGMVIPEEVR